MEGTVAFGLPPFWSTSARELSAGGEVVATTLRVDKIDGFGEIKALEQVTAEPADIRSLKGEAFGKLLLHGQIKGF